MTRDVRSATREDGAYAIDEEKQKTSEMDVDTLILRAMEAVQRSWLLRAA